MNRATKSVLLSALVYPGAGHLFLKRYRRGAALMALTTAGLGIMVVKTVHKAMVIVEKLQYGEIPLDAQAISRLLATPVAGVEVLVLDMATYGVVCCWLVGILDSYKIGKSEDGLS